MRPKSLPESIEKVCKACQKTFLVSYYLRNRRTYCSKTCANSDPDIKAKIVSSQTKTFVKKYGMHPMKTDQTKENLKASVMEKYGVDWISKTNGWYDRVKETNRKKYGIENYNNIEQIRQTCMEKYGVPNYILTDEYKERYKQTCMEKYGVTHASMGNHFKEEHNKTTFEKFLSHPKFTNFTPVFTIDDFKGVAVQDYKFKCNRCNTIKSYNIDDGRYPLCPSCDKNNCSSFQNGVYEYIKSILGSDVDIKLNDRTIISPLELDIIIPSLNIAIECDGILWHSELFGRKNKNYHLNKTTACLTRGYKLIHIFENEWNLNPDIVKSVLSTIFQKNTSTIYARKCEVREISSKLCSSFLNTHHLQGSDNSSIKIGLFNENELISVMTFLKSRFDANIQYEMGRFCSKGGLSIVGGASKLFSYFLKTYRPSSVISYSDRRYFDGQVYLNLGFNFMGNTNPNYFYIIDNYQNIQNRICWQKHKLKKKLNVFDEKSSEWENMKANGFDRIWNCGNGKWIWTIH